MTSSAVTPPKPGPHGVPVEELTQALARWSARHPHAEPEELSDTAPVPVRVDTSELTIHPGLLRQLAILLDQDRETWENAEQDPDSGHCAHCGGTGNATSAAPPDPSGFDSYLGLDGLIYHGVGEPDVEATAEANAEDGPDSEDEES